MRIAIVGTELCAVDARGGGLEQVLRRWAAALAEDHDVVVVSHRPGGRRLVTDALSARYETVGIDRPSDLGAVLARVAPDVVSLHNRPQWAERCPPSSRAAVTMHNYPVAWRTRMRRAPDAALSAVSGALAGAAADRLRVPAATVTVVPPSIDPAYVAEPAAAGRTRTVLAPNRLMRKKGVAELLEVAGRPELADVRFEFTDLISPWLRPTREHRALRGAVAAVANATLVPPAAPGALAARYAAAGVVACVAQEPEGLGLVPLEAQACGAPVVTTDMGGLAEATFAPNACVAAGEPDALAAALQAAIARAADDGPRRAVLTRYAPATSAAAFARWLLRG